MSKILSVVKNLLFGQKRNGRVNGPTILGKSHFASLELYLYQHLIVLCLIKTFGKKNRNIIKEVVTIVC